MGHNLRKRKLPVNDDDNQNLQFQSAAKKRKITYTIKKLTERYVDDVLILMDKLFTEEELLTIEEIIKLIKQNQSYATIQKGTNKLLAFILIEIKGLRKELFVHHIAVEQEYQGRGLGKALIEHAKTKLEESTTPFEYLALKVNKNKPELIKFYERLDFTEDPNEEKDGYISFSYYAEKKGKLRLLQRKKTGHKTRKVAKKR